MILCIAIAAGARSYADDGATEAPPCNTDACQCEAGDVEACFLANEALFRYRGSSRDAAIRAALATCLKDHPESCLQAARFMRQQKITSQWGKTPAELRQRGIDLLEAQCQANRQPVCARLGKYLLLGEHMAADPARAVTLLENACRQSEAQACHTLGQAYAAGKGVAKDDRRALALIEKSCTAEDALGCVRLAADIEQKDRRRATSLYARACAAGELTGCVRAGRGYERAKDNARAIAAFLDACELRDHESCINAARLMERGNERSALERARELYEHACEEEVGAGCRGLASLVATGRGGARNWGGALDLYQQACDLGDARACSDRAKLARRPPDAQCTTIDSCEALCEEKLWKSCEKLVELHLKRGDEYGCWPTEEIGLAYEAGCTSGDSASCIARGNLDEDVADAEQWYQQACRAGHPEGCPLYEFARYSTAEPDAREPFVRALRQACGKRQGSWACVWLAELAETKEADAVRLLRKACDAKNGEACRVLAFTIDWYPTAGTSSGRIGLSDNERRARAAAHDEGIKLLRRGCQLGNAASCVHLSERDSFTSGEARARELDPCSIQVPRWRRSP